MHNEFKMPRLIWEEVSPAEHEYTAMVSEHSIIFAYLEQITA